MIQQLVRSPQQPQSLMHAPRMHTRAACRVYKSPHAQAHTARHDQQLLASLLSSIYKPNQPVTAIEHAQPAINSVVTSPDGRQVQALVPQIHVVAREGDLRADGALLAGRQIDINISGNATNSGNIAGRQVVRINADTINNLGGTVAGAQVGLTAAQDINNIGGAIIAQDKMILNAGRDINIASTTMTGTGSQAIRGGSTQASLTQIDRVAGLYVTGKGADGKGGVLVANAGRDIRLTGAIISSAGAASLDAKRDIQLATLTTGESTQGSFALRRSSGSVNLTMSQDVGTTIQTGGNLLLNAGRDITAKAATINSQEGATQLTAGRDIQLLAGESKFQLDSASAASGRGLLGSSSTKLSSKLATTEALGSTVGGKTILIDAGRDIQIKGSTVISDQGTVLLAGRDITITAAQNTTESSTSKEVKKSGIMGGGGASIFIGSKSQSDKAGNQSVTQAGSTIGSINGNVTLIAGNNAKIEASSITTPGGDITILGKSIQITDLQNTAAQQTESKTRQSGLTVSISSPVLSAAQTITSTAQAASQSKDGRTQALALATGALAARNAADAIKAGQAISGGNLADKVGGISLSASLGSSRSQSNSESNSSTSAGSTLAAGGNIAIAATGGGKDSNILIQGSQVRADGNVSLSADNKINIVAGESTSSSKSTNKSSSASIGVSVNLGAGGANLSLNASASRSRGNSDGSDVSYTNSKITAGNQLTITSAGDTSLIGANVAGKSVIADIGGNLTITSLQDTATYQSKERTVGGGFSVPIIGAGAPSASVNAGRTNINSNFQSVTQQSGIAAGDGGFDIVVSGKTALTGAVITSTDKASEQNKNSLITGSLVTIDLQNKAAYSANTTSIGISYSGQQKDAQGNTVLDSKTGNPVQGGYNGFNATPPVALNAAGNANSITSSGISGNTGGNVTLITNETAQITLTGKDAETTLASINTKVVTGVDTTNALRPIFNEAEIKAGFAVTQAFVQQASTYLGNRAKEADDKKKEIAGQILRTSDPAEISRLQAESKELDKWGQGGTYHQIGTAIMAAATGNVTGGGGQLVQAAAVNYLQSLGAQKIKEIADSIGSEPIRAALHTILACAGAAAQSASCASAGAAAGLSSIVNSLLTDSSNATPEQKSARANLLAMLMTGIAAGLGGDAAIAATAARIETENNALYRNTTAVSKIITPQIKALEDKLQAGTLTPQQYAAQRRDIDVSAAKIDALTTIYNVSDKLPLAAAIGKMAPQHMAMAGEALMGFLAVPGMAISAYELVTGRTPLGEEANLFFSALGVIPAVGMTKAVGKAADLVEILRHAPSVKAAEQIAANQAKGKSFEDAVIAYLGSPVAKNTESFTIVTNAGKSVTVIPDAVLGGEKILEIKNVAYLTNSPQLRAYVQLVASGATTNANNALSGVELVVTTGTRISEPLQRMLQQAQATVKIFDPVTKTMADFKFTAVAKL